MKAIVLLAMGLSLYGATIARADGSAADGGKLFKQKCGICHTIQAGQNRVGPSMAGIVGRKAGYIDSYSYSDAMRSSGLTWDAATLDAYLANPRGKVPGTKMTFPGLSSAKDRTDLIAYLSMLK
jgi:cytochrome c